MAALVLKQIEKGSVSFAGADTSKTVTLATTLSDTTKTLLLFSLKCNTTSPVDHQILGKIISTTQIQFERQGSPAIAADVEYQVIEFISGISIQHLVVTPTGATTSVTITSINTAKTFAIGTVKQSGVGFASDDCVLYDITTSTNLNVIMQTFSASAISAIQVVQIDDAAVQKISTSAWTSGATFDLTVTSITENKTFFVFALTDNDNLDTNQWPYLSYINSTTLRFTKNFSGPYGSKNIITYVISLSSGVTVQNISTTIASGNSSVSPAITSVTAARSALHLNGIYQRLASSSESADNAGNGAFALASMTATAFTATRAASPAYAAVTNVQVLEFAYNIVEPDSLFDKCFDTCFEPCME